MLVAGWKVGDFPIWKRKTRVIFDASIDEKISQ